jgi:putative tryptophan/tyrosine transport system substrate-binding protein
MQDGKFATLTTRHRVPAIYEGRDVTELGGLVRYGTSVADVCRQCGMYTGRALKEEKAAELPVMQSTRFEFVIDLQTARTLGFSLPEIPLARADEVIE